MWKGIKSLLSGGIVTSLEKVALEYIDTAQESAEAKAIMIKTLDPNGLMRRQLARFASQMYAFYLVMAVLLIMMYAIFGFITASEVNETALKIIGVRKEIIGDAVSSIVELFMPITGAWGTIVTASFGVNYANVKANK